MIQSSVITLGNLLRFEPTQGRITLKDYRMVMLSAAALGCLRRELIETLGRDEARALMKRFGHAAGLADGKALLERFPDAPQDQHMDFGPALHALEGVTRVTRDDAATEIDLDAGVYHQEAYWENSYEADQHLELIGKSDEPVCWTLAGYATGHSSSVAGRETVVVETECRAMGHKRCRFVMGFADEMPDEARRENPDYVPHHLPGDLEELQRTISSQREAIESRDEALEELRSRLASSGGAGGLLGTSRAMHEALDMGRVVAPVDTTVLIRGESGTGKELMARTIHERSSRAGEPFVAVNCSALPENLQEAELFGFVKGAFTGAVNDSRGLFEAAHGGTLFLDEIGDLSLSAQTKILRALQEGEIKRVGESRTFKVDVRVLAATHRPLERMIVERTFREDLFYRLSVVSIEVPPLRERGDDVLLLADHFAKLYARRFDKKVRGISRAAACTLSAYAWPGNVRELQNAVQRGVILARGKEIDVEDLPETVASGALPGSAPPAPLPERETDGGTRDLLARLRDEDERIAKALELAEGNRERAARMLGISRTTLWRKMKEHASD